MVYYKGYNHEEFNLNSLFCKPRGKKGTRITWRGTQKATRLQCFQATKLTFEAFILLVANRRDSSAIILVII